MGIPDGFKWPKNYVLDLVCAVFGSSEVPEGGSGHSGKNPIFGRNSDVAEPKTLKNS